MCGILGVVNLKGITEADRTFLTVGTSLMSHRGPDSHGVWSDRQIGMGHRRLAIIDLQTGDQPMADASGRYQIVFNGEIYNFKELRRELIQKGFIFRTHSDTEVILNAYARWGKECVERFNGIFAFGLWDLCDQTLFLARDHLGVKPLLYSIVGDYLLFSSELKSLLKHPAIKRDMDVRALSDYLSLGYILSPKTIVRDVQKLPPGSRLIWKNGAAHVDRYWNLSDVVNRPPRPFSSKGEAVEALTAEVDRAVRTQLVSDVPVGSFLSGGIDSSSVTQKMVSFYPDKVHSFSIGFIEKSYSELPYARAVANFLHTEHHEQIVSPDVTTLLPQLAWYYDEPFSDTSAVPTYLLCCFARSFLKVTLSGDGGDECFAGYDTYLADKVLSFYQRFMPGSVHRRILMPLVDSLPANHHKVSWNYKIKQFIRHAEASPEEGHFSWRLIFTEKEKQEFLVPEFYRDLGDYTPYQSFLSYYDEVPEASPLRRSLYVDAKTWLADAMLVKVDRASMAAGLEVRVPLLDYKLFEFATALPDHYKIDGWQTKAIFKSAMGPSLPPAIAKRRKRGFNAPAAHWVKGLDPEFFMADLSLVNDQRHFVDALLKSHRARRADNGFKLWTLMGLSQWYKSVMKS